MLGVSLTFLFFWSIFLSFCSYIIADELHNYSFLISFLLLQSLTMKSLYVFMRVCTHTLAHLCFIYIYIYPFVGTLIGFYTFSKVGLTSLQSWRTFIQVFYMHCWLSIKRLPWTRTSVDISEMVAKPAWPPGGILLSPSYFLLSSILSISCVYGYCEWEFFALYVCQLVIAGRRERHPFL